MDRLYKQLSTLAGRCVKERNFDAALVACRQALALRPGDSEALMNLGAVHWNMCNFVEAEELYKQAIFANNENSHAHGNYGLLLQDSNRWDEAIQQFETAIELNPTEDAFKWDRMVVELDRGNWAKGFKDYDVRMQYKKHEYMDLPYPTWRGQSLDNKVLFIQTEQGVGDRIMCSRFLPLIKQRWPTCKILLLTEATCLHLFWPYRCNGTIDEFIPQGVPHPTADYGVYIMSLIGIFETMPNSIPPRQNLLRQYGQLMKPFVKLKSFHETSMKIGICWSGNPKFIMNHWREVPLPLIMTMMDDPRVNWFSFQTGERTLDIKHYAMENIIVDLESYFKKEGWNGTMACALNMDLIITCDTAMAHLAGELNIPVWVMLNFATFWPLGRDGQATTGWYPSMKLFRQKTHGDWSSVINNVQEELNKLKSEKYK